jgi:hypothetical protein
MTKGGGPAKRALLATRLTAMRWTVPTGLEASVEAAAGDCELTGEAARVGAKRAGRDGVRDVDRGDLDSGRLARRQEDGPVRGEGAERRSARGAVGEALRHGIEVQEDVRKAHRLVRRGEADDQLGLVDAAVEAEGEGAVGRLAAGAFEEEGALAAAEAVAGQGDGGGPQLQIAEVEDEVVAADEVGLDIREAAREAGEEFVVEAADPGLALAGDQRAVAAGVGHHLQLAGYVDQAEAGDEVAGEAARDDDSILAVDQVDEEAELALQFVGGEGQAFAGEQLLGDLELALDAEVGEDPAGDVADSGHPAGGEQDRDGDRRLGQAAAAFGADVLEAGLVEGDSRRGEAVDEGGSGEGAVEKGEGADLLAGHVREHGGRTEQVGADADCAEGAPGEVDCAFCLELQRGRAERQAAVELAVGEGGLGGDQDDGRGEPRLLAGPERRRGGPAGEAETALVGGELQLGGAAAGDVEKRGSGPGAPAAVAFDGEADRALGAEHRACDASGGGGKADVEVEMVAVGLGVEVQAELVAAALDGRVEADEGSAGADLHFAGEAADAGLAGHRGVDPDLGDIEMADVDVEAGEDRPRLLRRHQLGQAVEEDEIGIEPVDRQAVGHPGERVPVRLDQRGLGEQPLGVVEPDVAKPRVVPDRAFDPADADLEARGRRHRGDAIGDEAVAGGGVEQNRDDRGDHDEGEGEADDELGEAAHRPAVKAAPLGRGRRGFLVVHQNAWPRET